MSRDRIKRYVGKTPLIRAKNLEKYLGVSQIYIKLEGNNPSGYLEDRLAYLIIRDALEKGKTTICMGLRGRVMYSLAFLSKYFNIKCVFFVPNKNRFPKKYVLNNSENIEIIEHGKTNYDCLIKSNEVSKQENWYNANVGKENNILYNYTYSYLAKEINGQVNSSIDSIFCQTGQGSSISGLYWGLKQLWIDEDIEKMPRLFACTSEGSSIVNSFNNGTKEIVEETAIRNQVYSRELFEEAKYNTQEALNALYDTRGEAIGIGDQELESIRRKVQELENIKLTSANALPMVALFKSVKEGKIKDGVHVIILKDGRVELDVSRIDRDELPVPYSEFVNLLHTWLNEYTDPVFEINEALEKAFKDGHVLCAYQNGDLVGITVLIRTGFEQFFPKFHLGYIATKKGIKGRGIGTQLLKKAIEVTGGNLSLHVDTQNANAVKLYEKIGFKKKYFRMIYEGVEKQ